MRIRVGVRGKVRVKSRGRVDQRLQRLGVEVGRDAEGALQRGDLVPPQRHEVHLGEGLGVGVGLGLGLVLE